MTYTARQIAIAKARYNSYMVLRTIRDYDLSVVGRSFAEQDRDYHNNQINAILAGDRELEKKIKYSILNDIVMADQKEVEKANKLAKNKADSVVVLAPLKAIRKITAFNIWLNKSGNKFRSQAFSKKYTTEAVDAYLATI